MPPRVLRMPPRRARLPRQQGLAIGVVIATLMIIVAITAALSVSSHDPANFTRVERIRMQLVNEGMLIRQQILRCATDYPDGNNGGSNPAYPAGTGIDASTLTCPGNGNAAVFDNTVGVFYPAAVEGCAGWTYDNTATYVRIALVCADRDAIAALQTAATILGNDALLSTTNSSNDTLTLKVIDD